MISNKIVSLCYFLKATRMEVMFCPNIMGSVCMQQNIKFFLRFTGYISFTNVQKTNYQCVVYFEAINPLLLTSQSGLAD